MAGGFKNSIRVFKRSESGAMLVLFAICSAAVFLVAALSFDLGKRASTQTELQSFADSVALAAAGELDGQPGAMTRAQTAANNLIIDEMTFGEGDKVLSGAEDFTLSLYDNLPADETDWDTPLDGAVPENDHLAKFARIDVTPVQVPWSFARLLNVFSDAALPPDVVNATAAAGYAALACNVAAVFFCAPEPVAGVDTEGFWDPANHIGAALELSTQSGDGSTWGTGGFGFIDATRHQDSASVCAGETGADLSNCLLNTFSNRMGCLENGLLRLDDETATGISASFFNTRMGIYQGSATALQNVPEFANAPIVTTKYDASSTCGPGAGTEVEDATAFFADDCLRSNSCSGLGDGDWSEARLEYVDRNYSTDVATIGTVEPAEVVSILGVDYHVDDPFRPGDAATPRRSEYSSFPIVNAGDTRWKYYNSEVAAAYFEAPAAAMLGSEVDFSGVSSSFRATPMDLLQVTAPDGTVIPRSGSSLPQCAPANTELDPRRRAFIAAAVDCGSEIFIGAPRTRALAYVELFVLGEAEPSGSGGISFNAEIISSDLQGTAQSYTNGTFRNFVQLYR